MPKYNISKMSDLDVLSLLNVRSVKLDLMVNDEKKQQRLVLIMCIRKH